MNTDNTYRAMTQDFMTTWFANNTSLPGTHRPQDAYHWLEDSDDENEKLKARASHIPRSAAAFGINSAPPTTLNDLRNANGKRALHETSIAPNDPRAKRMRMENVQREAVASSGQARPSTRPRTIDLSVSPPPPVRSTEYGRQQQNGHARQILSSNGHTLNNQQQQYTTTTARPHSMSTHARDPGSNPATQRSTSTTSVLKPQAAPPPRMQTPHTAVKRKDRPLSAFVDTAGTAIGPFMVDDSSDDEEPAKPVRKSQPAVKTANSGYDRRAMARVPEGRPQISSAEREHQLLESRKRRQEAAELKRETPSSLGVREDDGERHGDEMEIELPRALSADRSAGPSVLRQSLETLHQALSQAHPPAREAVIDLTNSNGPTIAPNKPGTFAPATARQHPADQEYERAKAYVEGKRKREAEHLVQTRALQEKERQEAQARKAADIKQQLDFNEQQHSRAGMQAECHKQAQNRAEAAQRSLAIVEAQRKLEAQKKLDAQKEAVAKRQEQEKRRLEQAKWDERKRAEDVQREALRKRQAEMEKEKSTLDDRQAALARLSAVRPPQPAPKPQTQPDTNDVVAKHTAPQGLHFKDGDGSSIAADTARKNFREIQDCNAPAETPSGAQMSERDRRIKAMAERNLRLREAEERERDQVEVDDGLVLENDDQLKSGKGRRDSRAPTPTLPSMPKGPQSLSSAAGQALLAARPPNGTSNSQPKPTPPDKNSRDYHNSHYRRQLSEILPEDIQLVQWRDTGMRFQDVAVLFEKRFGVAKNFDTHRKRYRQVKEALRDAGIADDERLLERVVSCEAAARAEINRTVHGRWPFESETEPQTQTEKLRAQANERQRDARGHFLPVAEGPAGRVAVATPKSAAPGRNLNGSFGSSTTDGTLAHGEHVGARPTTGGKTMNDEMFMHILEGLQEEREEAEAEALAAREPSPVREEDRRRFDFIVQRREISQTDLDDGFELDDSFIWGNCDKELVLDNVEEANAKAGGEAYCVPPSMEDDVDLTRPYSTRVETRDHGCKFIKHIWEGAGEVEIRVVREDKYHKDGRQPRNKARWLGRTLYLIYHRQTTRSGFSSSDDDDEDLFAEKQVTDTTRVVGEQVYSSLEEANVDAIKYFVGLTFESTSGHLTQREMDVRAVEHRLKEELEEEEAGAEEGEEVCWRREIESEDRKSRVEVWVGEVGLKGPRNL